VPGDVYVRFKEVFDPAWTVTLGACPVVFDIRGRGDVLFLDATHAENPFPDAERHWATTVRVDSQPAGAKINYQRDQFTFELGIFPIALNTTGSFNILAAGVDNPPGIYYLDMTVKVDDMGSRIGAIFALFHGFFPRDNVYTFGAGGVFVPQKDLELFLEGYIQFGNVWSTGRPVLGTPSMPPHAEDGAARGWALQAGARIDVPGDTAFWAELVVIYITGQTAGNEGVADEFEDGDPTGGGFANPDVDEVGEFLHYESNNRMVIMDSNQWGLDIDNNIIQISLSGAALLSTGAAMKNNLHLILRLAYGLAVEEWQTDNFGNGTTDNTADSYGFEVDATARYHFNKNANVYLTIAYLFASDIVELFNREEQTWAYIILIGTQVNY
jgi:hypothetical protein